MEFSFDKYITVHVLYICFLNLACFLLNTLQFPVLILFLPFQTTARISYKVGIQILLHSNIWNAEIGCAKDK